MINAKRRALKGFTQSFEISLKSDRDTFIQLQNTRLAISRLFGTTLNNKKRFQICGDIKRNICEEKELTVNE